MCDKNGIRPVTVLNQQSPKVIVWKTCRKPVVNWSDLCKGRLKLKVLVLVVLALVVVVVQSQNNSLV